MTFQNMAFYITAVAKHGRNSTHRFGVTTSPASPIPTSPVRNGLPNAFPTAGNRCYKHPSHAPVIPLSSTALGLLLPMCLCPCLCPRPMVTDQPPTNDKRQTTGVSQAPNAIRQLRKQYFARTTRNYREVVALRAYCACRCRDTHPTLPITCLTQPCKEVPHPCTIEAMDIDILLLVFTQVFRPI